MPRYYPLASVSDISTGRSIGGGLGPGDREGAREPRPLHQSRFAANTETRGGDEGSDDRRSEISLHGLRRDRRTEDREAQGDPRLGTPFAGGQLRHQGHSRVATRGCPELLRDDRPREQTPWRARDGESEPDFTRPSRRVPTAVGRAVRSSGPRVL